MDIVESRRRMAMRGAEFKAAHYPKWYETRMESYPLRRRVGLFLVIAGAIAFAVGVLQHQPAWIASGGGVVALSFWLARARLCTIVLHVDRIEMTQGKDHEVRLREQLLGWKYAQESDLRNPRGAGQQWVLLVSDDEVTPPLMLEITRPELDRDFMDWVFSLRDLHQPLDTPSADSPPAPADPVSSEAGPAEQSSG